MIDFTKAFDTVDHVILLYKLSQLSLPGFVINWIRSFLYGRGQQCKVNGLLSNVIDIGLNIVQGSGTGPTLYIVTKNDSCTVSAVNDIFKYADDTTLLVPQHSGYITQLKQQKSRKVMHLFSTLTMWRCSVV